MFAAGYGRPKNLRMQTMPFQAAKARGLSGLGALILSLLAVAASIGAAQVIEFLPGSPSVYENGFGAGTNLTVIVTRTPATGTSTVAFATADGTAFAGGGSPDYVGTNGVLTFLEGESFQVINIPVLDDALTEIAENFSIALFNPTDATLGAATNMACTIFDNDTLFRFNPVAYTVLEDVTNVVLTVERQGDTSGSASVDFQTASGTAVSFGANPDFTATSGTLQFSNGQAFATVTVLINDDCVIDQFNQAVEFFTVTLVNAVGGSVSLVAGAATVTITDNDSGFGSVRIISTELNPSSNPDSAGYVSLVPFVREGNTATIRVRVRRECFGTNGIAVDITNFLSVASGTCPGNDLAEHGADYTIAPRTLRWGNNEFGPQFDQFFTITLVNDVFVELDELVTFSLVRPRPDPFDPLKPLPSLRAPFTLPVTIRSDDLAAGSADPSFNALNIFNPTPGANGEVYAVSVVGSSVAGNNGKILLAGDFTAVDAVVRNRIARLNGNGLNDATFNPGSGADGFVAAVLEQPDGRILIGGGFTSINGISRVGVARLNEDGSIDNSFSPGSGVHGVVHGLARQSDGRILIAGDFDSYNDVPVRNVARLLANGTLDGSFNPGTGPDDVVWAVAVADASATPAVYLGGDFFSVNGQPRHGVARLNSDGTVDGTFEPPFGADGPVYALAVQPDGAVLVGGAFLSFDGVGSAGLVRLLPNAAHDNTFSPGTGIFGAIYDIKLQNDGRTFIVGDFSSYNQTPRTNIARLYADGTLDTSFLDVHYNQLQPGPNGFLNTVAVQANGGVIAGGAFTSVGGGYDGLGGMLTNAVTPHFNYTRFVGGDNPEALNMPGNVQFALADYTVDENVLGGQVAVSVQRLNGTVGSLTVTFYTVDATGEAGSDFVGTTSTVTWADCSLGNRTVFVPINDNVLVQGNRTFSLVVANPVNNSTEAPTFPALGARTKTTVTIVDNDFNHGALGFSAPIYTVNEDGTNATIHVSRTNGSVGQVSVQYATYDLTATNADYTPKSGTLTFASGATNQTLTIPIVNDLLAESEEWFGLRLTNVTGGAVIGLSNTVVRILDNEPSSRGSVSFASAGFVVNEGNATATITLRRTSGALGAIGLDFVAFDFAPGLGLARAGIDYTPVTNHVVFGSGVLTQTVTVPILPDSFVEGNETVGLALLNVTNGSIGFISSALLTIADDDAYGSLTFGDVNFFTSERATHIVISVSRVDGRSEEVSVDYSTVALSAAADVDFVVTNGTLVFPDGVTTGTITIPILNDVELEGNEQFGLVLGNFLKASPGAYTTAFITIIDDESLDAPAGSVDTTFEAHPNGFITALGLQSSGNLVVGGDFTTFNNFGYNRLARLTLTGTIDPLFSIGSGANGQVQAIVIQPDDKILIGGRFTTYNTTNRARLARLNADGTIDSSFNPGAGADNPVFALALTADRRVVLGGSFTTFNGITRPNVAVLQTNGAVDVSFNTGAGVNGTVYAVAVQPDGKILIGGDFTFVNNTNRARIARLNANGSLDLGFNPGSGAGAAVRAIALQPDGKVVIGGSFTNVNGSSRTYVARLLSTGAVDPAFHPGAGGDAPVLALGLQPDGRILAAGDFHAFNGVNRNRLTRLMPDGTTDPSINFGTGANSFISALLIQANEQIVIGGGFTEFNGIPRPYVARLLGGENAGAGTFNFLQPVFTAAENGTNIAITVLRQGGTAGTGTVHFATFDFTAVAPGNYTATNGTLRFPPGENLQTFTVSIGNNTRIDGDLHLFLSLDTPSPGAQLGFQSDAALVIGEDDASVQFFTESYSVNEASAGSHATVAVLRSGSTNAAVAVQYQTTFGTAIDGLDYASTNGLLVFAPGEAVKVFTVPVFEDALVEGPETVGLEIFNPVVFNSPLSSVALGLTNATLTVVDNDFQPGEFTFTVQTNFVNEFEAYAIVTVLRTNGSSGIVSVRYGATDGTASGVTDYQRVNGILSFADGETVKTFSVPVFDDSRVEADETILLVLSSPTGGAAMGAINNQTLVILDDEAGVAFEAATYAVAEDDGAVQLAVLRTGNTNFAVSVGFATTNLSATAPGDYLATNGTLFFAAGQTRLNINVPIVSDNVVEATEQFRACLSNGSANVEIGAISNAVVNIQDSARFVQFETDSFFVDEGDTNALITLTRSGLATRGISVIFSTRDGTARAGADYFATSQIVKFAAGVSNVTVLVPIIDDGIAEFPETILLELSFATNSTIGTPGAATLTINNNDPGPGGADNTFHPGAGANKFVRALALQADGKVLVGGAFTNFADVTNRNYLARVETNGVYDPTFLAGASGPNALVSALAVAADQKIVLGGNFTGVNGTNRNRVARLDSTGSLDITFSQPLTFDAAVLALAVQPDLRILAGGGFANPTRGLARLRLNGTPDLAFDVGAGADGLVHVLSLQPDGQILVGGSFTNVGGFTYPRLARLGTSGLVDSTFNTLSVTSGIVHAIAVQADGKILIGGTFRAVNGLPRGGVARLNPDGTLDLSFDPGAGVEQGTVYTLGVMANGSVFIAGDFTSVAGIQRNRYALLGANGAVDLVFDATTGADNTIYTSVIQPDQKILIGGDFTSVAGATRRGVARLNTGDFVPSSSVTPGGSLLTISAAGILLQAVPDRTYVLEGSSNLLNWMPLSTNTATSPVLTFPEPDRAGAESRFYRVRRVGP